MEQEDRIIMTRVEWAVVFSVLASAVSLVFSAGVIWTTVKVHDVKIDALERQQSVNTDRLARIETKIDLLIGERGK